VTDATTGTILFFHGDHLGSASVITDYSGTEQQRLQYFPYGGTRYDSLPTDKSVKHRFTGHEKDFSIGIYYAQARYYDQRMARFISCDPYGGDLLSPQSLNPYVYCLNNPLVYVDPKGEEPEKKAEEKGNKYAKGFAKTLKGIIDIFCPISAPGVYVEKLILGINDGKSKEEANKEALGEVAKKGVDPSNVIPALGTGQALSEVGEGLGEMANQTEISKALDVNEDQEKYWQGTASEETKKQRANEEKVKFNVQKRIDNIKAYQTEKIVISPYTGARVTEKQLAAEKRRIETKKAKEELRRQEREAERIKKMNDGKPN